VNLKKYDKVMDWIEVAVISLLPLPLAYIVMAGKIENSNVVIHGKPYIYIYIYIYIYTYIHTCLHTYIQAYIHTYIYTYVLLL
jgi:hypothetical protein